MFKRLSSGWPVLALFVVFGFSACDDDDDDDLNLPQVETVTDVAAGDERFTTLVSALQRINLDGVLDTPSGRYTVFAPTNAAFAASGLDLNALSDDELRSILSYHVISGDTIFRTANIPDGETALKTTNVDGPSEANRVIVNSSGGSITVNGANVVEADIEGLNGVIHAIDQVLIPPTITSVAIADGRFTTLVAALQRVGLAELFLGLGDFTVFAPTDAAFAAAGIDLASVSDDDLEDLLRYHALSGAVTAEQIANGNSFSTTLSETGPDGAPLSLLINKNDDGVTLNGDATVVIADIFTSNGVIHAIDQVLAFQNITDIATKAENLTTLSTALASANLVDNLSADGPFTVFAPTNDAFADIGFDLDAVTQDDLTALLLYHVVSGAVTAEQITAGSSYVATLSETGPDDAALSLLLNNSDGVTLNNDATVALADVVTTNGIIHIIDKVLALQSVVDLVANADNLTSLATSLTDADLIDALSSDGPFTVFAPTNAAFTAAADTITTLTSEQVSTVLTYHVIGGANVRSNAIPASADALNMQTLEFSGDGNATIETVAGQTVPIVLTDIQGTNGVVHLIESVLLPAL